MMDYSKISFWFYLSIIVIFSLIQEQTCRIGRKPRTPCPTLKIPNGFARLRSNGRVAAFKCKPTFKVIGSRTATCLRGQWEGEIPICVRNGCQKVYPPKNGDMVVTYAGALVMFFCNNGYSVNGSNHIYCNGVVWNGTVPTCQVDTSNPLRTCDFENEDLCGWTQDTQHNFDWRRHNFATPSGHVSTGPSYDHTKGAGQDGYYMYIESSSPRMTNDKARLFSPVYPAELSLDACFVFWYHMFGATIGSLNVYVKPEDMEWDSVPPAFTKSGDQGNMWFRKIVRFPNTTKPFQVIVEGVRGTGYVGDIAFDDVELAQGTDCIEPSTASSQTDTAKIETGGGGEVFDDAQSCRWRCSSNNDFTVDQSERGTSSPPETPVMVLCDCHLGCEDNKTCCPDYSSYCILAKVTSKPMVPTMGYRTIGSVHYFSLYPPPSPTRLPQPPPLPPLPPKPTMTSPELPNISSPRLYSIKPLITDKVQLESNSPLSFSSATVMPTKLNSNFSPVTTEIIISSRPTSVNFFSQKMYSSTSNSVENPIPVNNFTYSDMVEMPTVTSEFPFIENFTMININVFNQTEVHPKNPSKLSTKQAQIVSSKNPDIKNSTTNEKTSKEIISTTVIPITSTKKVPKINNVNDAVKNVIKKSSKLPIILTVPPFKPFVTEKQYQLKKTTPRIPLPSTKKSTGNRMYNPYSKDTKSNDVETSYILKKELIGVPKRKPGSISQQQSQQSRKESSLVSVPMIVGISAGLILVAVAIGITMFGVVWRRRASSKRNNLNEDSDVRFLTSDEALDFNIARPVEHEDLL